MLFKVASYSLVLLGAIQLLCAADDHLKDKFLNSCEAIKLAMTEKPGNCEVVYEAFKKGFKGKESSELNYPPDTQFDYTPHYVDYFELVGLMNFKITNMALFWSKTKKLQIMVAEDSKNIKCAHNIMGMRILDHLYSQEKVKQWCSHKDGNIHINEGCKDSRAKDVFWAEASKNMARAAEGVTYFMTSNGYFDQGSYYRKYELPTLLLTESKSVAIVVINIVSDADKDCNKGDVKALKEIAGKKKLLACFAIRGDANNPSESVKECVKSIIKRGENFQDFTPRCKLM